MSKLVAFNPIELASETTKKVIAGNRRKYNGFRMEHFYGQIATARGVGCNLRCCFCWINPSKDLPENYGVFYSPEEVYNNLLKVSSNEFGKWMKTRLIRISGCEPTIGKSHLLGFIEFCAKNDAPLILLETNGMLCGYYEEFVKELSELKEYFLIRLSIKAGTPEAFKKKTGAKEEFFELPFTAIRLFKKYGIRYSLATMSKNPEIMPSYERRALLEEIIKAGAGHNLFAGSFEEEKVDLFLLAQGRIRKSGLVKDLSGLNKNHYVPLDFLLKKWLAERGILNYEEIDRELRKIKQMPPSELIFILPQLPLYSTETSQCATCHAQNPWHGHGGVVDDLNELELGKFIH